MAVLNKVVLGKGTKLYFEDPDNAGDYLYLANAVSIGTLGAKGSFVEVSPIGAEEKDYIAGDQEPEEKEITFNDMPGDAVQERFIAMAQARDNVAIKVEYPNGRVIKADFALNGFNINEPARDAALTVTVYAQRKGHITLETMP
ncbi:MAG: phage tail tube protein [Exilibacterium sp.]